MDSQPNDILEKIESGELKKKSRRQFLLQTALAALGTALLLMAAIFLISFVFELLVSQSFSFFPYAGKQGFGFYLEMFPWIPVFGGILLIVILGFMLQQYSFVYRQPLVYLLLGIIAVLAAATFVLHVTSFHDRLYHFSAQHRLPVIRQFYGQYRNPRIKDY